jgi:hypothetical protein
MPEEEKKLAKLIELKKEEKDKHRALLAGVIFFMVLIIILWVMNLAVIFKAPQKKSAEEINIDKLTEDFQKSFNDVGAKMGELKTISSEELKKYPLQAPLVVPTSTKKIKRQY